MIYYIAKFLSKIALRVNFKKIFFHYQSEIPKDKAIIFAANHPTAFLDPVIIGTFLKRPTHFMVRGDIFKGKLILALLNGLKMLPIFRFRDGYSSLKNNQATMETVYDKLAENRCILILAEGETKHEKRLRPIQKGTARMAFGAIEANPGLEVLIFPVGVNYSDSDAYRSYVMTEVGSPIHVEDFMDVHKENPRRAIKQLTEKIEAEMRTLVIHIEDRNDDIWINRLLEIGRNSFKYNLFPVFSPDSKLWKKEYNAVEQFNRLSDTQKELLRKKVKTYDKELSQFGINDIGLVKNNTNDLLTILVLIIGFIPCLIGYVFSFLPLFLAQNIANKKIKKIEFKSSIRYGVGMVGYTIYWLIFLMISLIIKDPSIIFFVITLPFFGYFAQIYIELFKQWIAKKKFTALKAEKRVELERLRADLLDALG